MSISGYPLAGPIQGNEVILGDQGVAPNQKTVQFPLSVLRAGIQPIYPSGDVSGATDTANLAAAMAAGVTVVLAGGSYHVRASVSVAAGVRITGVGVGTVINFSGTGGLFTNAGQSNVEIDHLAIVGTNAASAWAIRHTTAANSALNCHYHHLSITSFGTGASPGGVGGGGISIESDSQRLTIDQCYFANKSVNIDISGPTDTLEIGNNVLSSQGGTGPVRGVNVHAVSGGPATQRIQHNNFTSEGFGAVTINTPSGIWIVQDNESETLNSFSNSTSSSFEFLQGIELYAERNYNNAHGFATYDFYVGNSVTGSSFCFNAGANSTSSSFYVGTGLNNLYQFNTDAAGPTHVYSADYPGIMIGRAASGDGVWIGGANPPFAANGFVGPLFANYSKATGSQTNAQFLAPNMGSTATQSLAFGQAFTNYNSAILSFYYAGSGSASNTASFGITGQPGITVDALGNVLCTTLIATNPSSASSSAYIGLSPNLATGNTVSAVVGAADTTNNGVFLSFFNSAGTGSASNYGAIGIVGGAPVTINANGAFSTPSYFAVGANQVVGARQTGWTAGTGAANKGAFATYAGQTLGAAYSQTVAQATDNAVLANAQRIKALEDAMRAHGLIN